VLRRFPPVSIPWGPDDHGFVARTNTQSNTSTCSLSFEGFFPDCPLPLAVPFDHPRVGPGPVRVMREFCLCAGILSPRPLPPLHVCPDFFRPTLFPSFFWAVARGDVWYHSPLSSVSHQLGDRVSFSLFFFFLPIFFSPQGTPMVSTGRRTSVSAMLCRFCSPFPSLPHRPALFGHAQTGSDTVRGNLKQRLMCTFFTPSSPPPAF